MNSTRNKRRRTSKPAKCLTRVCQEPGVHCRGLCEKCYANAMSAKRKGETTEEEMIKNHWILPLKGARTPFSRQLAEARGK